MVSISCRKKIIKNQREEERNTCLRSFDISCGFFRDMLPVFLSFASRSQKRSGLHVSVGHRESFWAQNFLRIIRKTKFHHLASEGWHLHWRPEVQRSETAHINLQYMHTDRHTHKYMTGRTHCKEWKVNLVIVHLLKLWICSLGQGWAPREIQYSAICRLFCHNNREGKFHLMS